MWRCILIIVIGLTLAGCKEEAAPTTAPSTRPVVQPTVASLVPGATNLIVDMGAADHLVAVSNYDTARPGIENLPRVGDYQDFDWERLSILKPQLMIVFMSPQRMPPALRERCRSLGIELANVRIERVEQIYVEFERLGKLLDEEQKGREAAERLRKRLEGVRRKTEGLPKVKVLLVREPAGDGVVGQESFLNDVVEIAGGENVIKAKGWPGIDREQLNAVAPEVVFHLLPGASAHVVEEARRMWRGMGHLPAVKNGKVFVMTEWYLLQPGMHLGELAEDFAAKMSGRSISWHGLPAHVECVVNRESLESAPSELQDFLNTPGLCAWGGSPCHGWGVFQ